MGIELTENGKKLKQKLYDRLIGKSGGRNLTDETLEVAIVNIDPETDSGKIALKCQECVFCLRDHAGYEHYRITDRSDCPSTCALNKRTYGS